jgi:hypothetical protein
MWTLVVTADEDGVHPVAFPALQIIAIQSALCFRMTDHRLNRTTPLEEASQRSSQLSEVSAHQMNHCFAEVAVPSIA